MVILNHLLIRWKQNRNTIDLILKFFVAIITRSFLSQLAMPLESCVRSCIKSRQWPNKESTLASSIQVTLYQETCQTFIRNLFVLQDYLSFSLSITQTLSLPLSIVRDFAKKHFNQENVTHATVCNFKSFTDQFKRKSQYF